MGLAVFSGLNARTVIQPENLRGVMTDLTDNLGRYRKLHIVRSSPWCSAGANQHTVSLLSKVTKRRDKSEMKVRQGKSGLGEKTRFWLLRAGRRFRLSSMISPGCT